MFPGQPSRRYAILFGNRLLSSRSTGPVSFSPLIDCVLFALEVLNRPRLKCNCRERSSTISDRVARLLRRSGNEALIWCSVDNYQLRMYRNPYPKKSKRRRSWSRAAVAEDNQDGAIRGQGAGRECVERECGLFLFWKCPWIHVPKGSQLEKRCGC